MVRLLSPVLGSWVVGVLGIGLGAGPHRMTAAGVQTTPPPASSLPVALRGVAVSTAAPDRSIAVIACTDARDAPTAFVRAGERACGTLEVVTVASDGVVIKNLGHGGIERLGLRVALTDVPGRIDVPVSRATIETHLQNIPAFLASALATPHVGPEGAIDGYAIGRVTPDGPIAALGFRDGDIIEAVNGEPVSNLPALMALAARVTTLGDVTIRLTRAGRPLTIVFTTK